MAPAASTRPILPLALRAALFVGLALVLLTGLADDDTAPSTARLSGDGDDVARLTELLIAAEAPEAIFRPPGDVPSETELALLAAAADRAPLTIGLPSGPLPVRVILPSAPRVGRFAAVRFAVPVSPGDTVVARLMGASGVVDSARVTAEPGRAAEGAFRVRPGVTGWTEWTIAVGPSGSTATPTASAATAGAWVADAGPPRVLVVAGPPSWESRYVIRALERSGVDLGLVLHLGRDNVITAGGAAAAWSEPSSLARYDVVLLLAGAAVDPSALESLAAWTAGGRGVVASSEAIGGLGLGSLAPTAGEAIAASTLEWTAPAEIVPLPPSDLDAAVRAFDSIPPVATAAAHTPDGRPFLVLAPLGRGRLVGLTPMESWRWVMDAGDDAAHRAFWRSLVDWAAAPAADSLGVRVEPRRASVGATVDVGSRAEGMELRRPGGSAEALASRFVATDTGTYEVRVDTATVAAFRATPVDAAPPADLGRARLALLAASSGGAVLDGDELEAPPQPTPGSGHWRVLVFAVLVALALAEWAVRRLRGLA